MAKQFPKMAGMQGVGGQHLNVRLTQIDETLNVPELEHTKLVSLFPKMGKSNILQYQLEGNFDMLPLKIYPTFGLRQEFHKIDIMLKANCRLPAKLRIKEMKIHFRVPETVTKVFFHTNADGVPSQGPVNTLSDV